jgi:hypothetical protein
MTAGWCSRTVRAAVFAAVCVLLAALGHVMMSGSAVPWWALAAATAATGGTAWCLAGRERGPLSVVSLMVGAQAALHASFTLAQTLATPHGHGSGSGGSSLLRQWVHHLLCDSMPMNMPMHMPVNSVSSMESGGATHSMASMTSMAPMDGMEGMDTVSPLGHGLGAMPAAGMLTAHLAAALMCGLWLAYGERAAFRILRALAGWLVAPLRLPLLLPAPPHRPRIRARRARSDRAPRLLLLVHAITSRGPPVGIAVA